MKPRVLMLPKWYPNRYDDQAGDFVARHVATIAPHADIAILFATVARKPLPQLIDYKIDTELSFPIYRYYYQDRITGFGPLDKLLKLILYFGCLGHGYWHLRRTWGRPQLVHVHVLLRTGLFAWWLKVCHRVPYLVTEHWSLYLPERAAGISWLRRILTRAVVRQAAALHTVSEALRDAMHALGFRNAHSVVIGNVVDTHLFRPALVRPRTQTLLNVSAFDDAVKNISGILRVVTRLRPTWPNLRLRIAGYGPDEALLRQLAQELNLLADGTVVFLGKLPQSAVATEMQQAAALVSFSRLETFGCVLLEARACGCPVVATHTAAVPELFRPEGAFGQLVPVDDEEALAAALTSVLAGEVRPDATRLHADAVARSSPAHVGQDFNSLYHSLLDWAPVPHA
ncbi:glycosyltransferase [Hymenobacter sp. BT491]|uniref:glycosyltransferase n=1 Tax=Hymenobacter sp. BT491 TaxID=2766779 RepID=UPI0016536FE7|nr:glycosyltransferase [Hymenobacter sp. BT491]MBC6991008.1 glycosyltransferase [Hymenobacter sp. BT491]